MNNIIMFVFVFTLHLIICKELFHLLSHWILHSYLLCKIIPLPKGEKYKDDKRLHNIPIKYGQLRFECRSIWLQVQCPPSSILKSFYKFDSGMVAMLDSSDWTFHVITWLTLSILVSRPVQVYCEPVSKSKAMSWDVLIAAFSFLFDVFLLAIV